MKRILRLNLKTEYFNAIRDGSKPEEYRLASKWEKRIVGKTFDEIHLLLGYPKRGDESRILRRKWNGYKVVERTHPHFGPDPVLVLAIDVTQELPCPVCNGERMVPTLMKGFSKQLCLQCGRSQ